MQYISTTPFDEYYMGFSHLIKKGRGKGIYLIKLKIYKSLLSSLVKKRGYWLATSCKMFYRYITLAALPSIKRHFYAHFTDEEIWGGRGWWLTQGHRDSKWQSQAYKAHSLSATWSHHLLLADGLKDWSNYIPKGTRFVPRFWKPWPGFVLEEITAEQPPHSSSWRLRVGNAPPRHQTGQRDGCWPLLPTKTHCPF